MIKMAKPLFYLPERDFSWYRPFWKDIRRI